MTLFITFILGFIVAFLGLIPPSMLNMTTVKISLSKHHNKINPFISGIVVTVFFQAFVALLIAQVLNDNQQLIIYIKEIAALIFIILAFYFFRKGFAERKDTTPKSKRIKNYFITGLAMSFLNMFAIPYYCAMGTGLDMAHYITLNTTSIFVFGFGATVGSFVILYLYAYLAKKVANKIFGFTKNINFILGAITGLVGLMTLIKLF